MKEGSSARESKNRWEGGLNGLTEKHVPDFADSALRVLDKIQKKSPRNAIRNI